ncbi:MAG: hypothetical protein IJO75_05575, partial [Clostridia bacterium]|nr:hypothetical protein [Clostridia bacterium]
MFKIVYVLTDNENLKYYNELMISLLSTRKHMPERPVCVLVDPTTYAILQKNNAEIFDLAEVLPIDVPSDLTQAEKSRYIKVTCRQWIRGDMLFIDTDTVICRPFPDKVSDKPLGFVLDGHALLTEASISFINATVSLNRQLGIEITRDAYYNSGVMWVADCDITKAFFAAWEETWQETRQKGRLVDQPSFNFTISRFEEHVDTLDGIWNVQ